MHDFTRSPVSILASFFSKQQPGSDLLLLSGSSGTGKTRWCQELIQEARLAGLTPGGLISPAVFEHDQKTGIDLQDVRSDERRRLAIRLGLHPFADITGPKTGSWQFDQRTIDWGNQNLDKMRINELLIIDEIGPLELLENRGLVSAFALLDERRYRLACVTVRPLLLSTALERWPWAQSVEIGGDASRPEGSRR